MFRASFGKTAAGRLLVGAGTLALLIPAVAGCEAGSNAPTLEFHPASAGAQTVFNGIKITNAFVLGAPSGATVPTGSSASMFLSLYNNNPGTDKLLSASAPGLAASVSLSGGTVALPGGSAVNLTGPQPEVVLNNLARPLTGGSNISVTLDFQHAGSLTFQVPVEAQSYDYATFSPPASPAASASATPSGTATAQPLASVSPTP